MGQYETLLGDFVHTGFFWGVVVGSLWVVHRAYSSAVQVSALPSGLFLWPRLLGLLRVLQPSTCQTMWNPPSPREGFG